MEDKSVITIIEDCENLPAVEAKMAVIIQDAARPDLQGVAGWLHPGGSIRDDNGRYIVRPAWSAGAFTGDSARAAVNKREAMRSAAVQDAIIKGTGVGPGDLAGGVGELTSHLVKIVVGKGRQDRDRIAAYKEIMRHAGLAYDLGRGQGPGDAGQGPGGLTSEAYRALNTLLPLLEDRVKGRQ